MKGKVHIRSYESIKHLSPKRRGYEMEKIMRRRREIEKTMYILFETNLLTLELHNELENIYRCLVNEYYKIKGFDEYYKQGYKKDKLVVLGGTRLQYSKEFKQRYLDAFNANYSRIENLIIEWDRDGDKTAGYLTRQILKITDK